MPVHQQEGGCREGRRLLPEDLQSATQSTPGTRRAGANRTDEGDELKMKSEIREIAKQKLSPKTCAVPPERLTYSVTH